MLPVGLAHQVRDRLSVWRDLRTRRSAQLEQIIDGRKATRRLREERCGKEAEERDSNMRSDRHGSSGRGEECPKLWHRLSTRTSNSWPWHLPLAVRVQQLGSALTYPTFTSMLL